MKKVIRLTENDIHRIVKNSVNNVLKEGVYTDEELGAQKIFDAAMKALQSLGKKANLIAYILNPKNTAVGANFSYNSQTLEDLLWQRILNYSRNLPKDGNADFTFKQICKMIDEGYFD